MVTTKQKHLKDLKIRLFASIIVVSDSLSAAGENNWKKLDTSAKKAQEILETKKVTIRNVTVVPDNVREIQKEVSNEIEQGVSLIVTIGGTGISVRDVTIEAVKPLLQKELLGFGELFRQKTFQEVGTVSIMTRALAGVTKETCVVCLPGSTNAVILGVNLIIEELLHIINLRR
ncbi:MAG: MogA/MoaB family molybdenum cofactor biosynthesis protein [Candidatus Hodarchaeales archaeon]